MPLTVKVWASSIEGSMGSKAWFSPVIWYIREREVRLSTRVLAIVISGAGAAGAAKKLSTEVK
jgi:hypothetical protein